MSESSIMDKLKEILPAVPDTDLKLLADICTLKEFGDKQVIMKSGNRKRQVFLILEGVARGFVVNAEGEEKTIVLRGKGIFVGDVHGLFTDRPQKLEIVAAGETEVLMFSFSEFERLSRSNENIQRIYMNSLKEAILRLTYRVHSMVTMSSEERYLDLLQMNPEFLEKSYDRYVAHYLGITPVSLSRIKKKLNLRELTNVNHLGG